MIFSYGCYIVGGVLIAVGCFFPLGRERPR
jgi:hypothetical protein